MLLLQVILLAILQGLTEFLPVSSSGHLVLGAAFFAWLGTPLERPITLEVILHGGTLVATIAFFRSRLLKLFTEDCRLIGPLLVATLPAVIVGLPLRKLAPEFLENPWVAATLLPVTGLILIAAQNWAQGQRDARDIPYWSAMVVGIFQAVAILPGISRSGATIAAGLLCGLQPGEAAAFSFLLAVPVMCGALVLEGTELMHNPPGDVSAGLLLLGFAASAVVGYGALIWLVRWLQTGRLYWFAWWTIVLGAISLIWLILR